MLQLVAIAGFFMQLCNGAVRIEPEPGSHLLGQFADCIMSDRSMERHHGDDLVDLLRAAKAGSSEAVGQLLDRHRDYLLLIANEELARSSNKTHSASDVVQWTHMEVCRDFQGFRGNTTGEFRAWLRRILLNNLADERRRVRPSVVSLAGEPSADDRSPSSQVAAEEINSSLYALIQTLPDDERRVIQLRYFEGKSYAEIAAVIGRSPDATRKLWTRVLARLQRHMRHQA